MLDLSLTDFKLAVTITSAVILFLFGIDSFSKEMQRIAGQNIRRFIARWTTNRWIGAGLGALVTAVVQSSSATSVLTVALVNIGIMSFHQSLGVIIGTNVGTTLTAQLVAWKLTGIGPFFIVLGFILTLARIRYSFLGRSIFYFGFVFFSLDVISAAVTPLKSNPEFINLMTSQPSAAMVIILGSVFTVIVQSSSVVTGIAVILVQQNLIDLHHGILLILGANIGTSFTAIFASWNMDIFAKRAALSHLLFNFLGVAAVLPFLGTLQPILEGVSHGQTGQVLANAHLFFNVSAMFLFLALLTPFEKLVARLMPSQMTEVIVTPDLLSVPKEATFIDKMDVAKREVQNLVQAVREALMLLSENFYNHERSHLLRANKLIFYVSFAQSELSKYIGQLSYQSPSSLATQRLTELVQLSLSLREIQALLISLQELVERHLKSRHQFSQGTTGALQSVTQKLDTALSEFSAFLDQPVAEQRQKLKRAENDLGHDIMEQHKVIIERMAQGRAPSGNILLEYLNIAQNLREKMNSLRKIIGDNQTATID